jgi:hypothetical protein
MVAMGTAAPRVVHSLPGRVRVHLPGWSRPELTSLEHRLRQARGVRGVRANALTGNVLIHFDPGVVDMTKLLLGVGPSPVRPGPTPNRLPVPQGPPARTGCAWAGLLPRMIDILASFVRRNPVGLILTGLEILALSSRYLAARPGI